MMEFSLDWLVLCTKTDVQGVRRFVMDAVQSVTGIQGVELRRHAGKWDCVGGL